MSADTDNQILNCFDIKKKKKDKWRKIKKLWGLIQYLYKPEGIPTTD